MIALQIGMQLSRITWKLIMFKEFHATNSLKKQSQKSKPFEGEQALQTDR